MEGFMGLNKILGLQEAISIDWDMTPEYSFGTFESWGGKERIRNNSERIYYFFIDNWGETPKLFLMERGIKHAKVLAEIDAPPSMVNNCVKQQGSAVFEKNFAINKQIKEWLVANVIDADDFSKIHPLKQEKKVDLLPTGLPKNTDRLPELASVKLPDSYRDMSEEEVAELIRRYNLFDLNYNIEGAFRGYLVDNGDNLTVSDKVTGLMWQRGGLDIMSHRMMRRELKKINEQKFAGYSDWRLPTIPEALSLIAKKAGEADTHLHRCFSSAIAFVFVNATRKTGGYWFVDFKQGSTFWASGTIPGGFTRLCRTEI